MTNQPSPVLTAEERFVIDLLATEAEAEALEDTNALGELDKDAESTEVGREHARNQMKIANALKGLLSRTADPDTVTLPREVVETWIKMMADCAMHGMPITPSIAKARNVTVKALAIPQAQGGDDE